MRSILSGLVRLARFGRPLRSGRRHAGGGRLPYVVLGAVTASLLVAGGAFGATRVATDRTNGVQFRLEGEVLTVRLVPEPDRRLADVRRELWGKLVRAVCSPSVDFREGISSIERQTRRWPRGQTTLRFRFRHDMSQDAKWCLLERPRGGADIALSGFENPISVVATSDDDRQIGRELRRYVHRNAGLSIAYWSIETIAVAGGVIAVTTTMADTRRSRWVANRLCELIQGADVADFTPGHTIHGQDGVQLKVCPARED